MPSFLSHARHQGAEGQAQICYRNSSPSHAARMADWLLDPKLKRFPKTRQVGFGLVLGSEGKRFGTCSMRLFNLVQLLDEAKSRSTSELLRRLENYLYPSCEYDH